MAVRQRWWLGVWRAPRLGLQAIRYVIGAIHISWRSKIVAGDGDGVEGPGAFVRDLRPGPAVQQDGVEARAAVCGGNHGRPVFAPATDHAVDRLGAEVGPVAEHD